MSKADNVPIATLAGIACLTELTSELPLPAASTSSKDVDLFGKQQTANNATMATQQKQDQAQLQSLNKLLLGVNTAYLDFKNSSYNCLTPFSSANKLPLSLCCSLQENPTIFQPQFDNYHGSPLKSNQMSALAYSPNQRNAFIRQQQLQQAMLQHQQPQQHFTYPQLQNQKAQPSPLLQGSQFSTGSSSPIKSPHVQQLFKGNNMPSQSPEVAFNSMASPKIITPHQMSQQQSTNQQQIQKHPPPSQVIQEQGKQIQEERAPTQQISPQQAPTQLVHSEVYQPAVKLEQIKVPRKKSSSSIPENSNRLNSKQQVHTENIYNNEVPSDSPFFSPLKTRGQRHEPPIVQVTGDITEDHEMEITENNYQLHEHGFNKNHKYKNDYKKQEQQQQNIPLEKRPSTSDDGIDQQLQLRVPKLIVRKVKRMEGSNQVETLEVYSPEKNKQFYRVNSNESFNGVNEVINDVPKLVDININSYDTEEVQQKTFKKSQSKGSRKSSIASVESVDYVKAQQKRKKKVTIESSSSSDENAAIEQDSKRFKHEDYNDMEGIEIKAEVKKFMFTLNKILDRELELEADGDLDINEDLDIPPETLLPRALVSTFCSEIAKMKSSNSLNEIPVDQLVRVMSVMDRHVRDTMQLILSQDEDEDESKKWLSIQHERIIRSAEAAVIILNITTAPDMPKQVYLEEAIEHVATLCQYQLENIVYPEFDGIYKMADAKDSFAHKTKRNHRSSGSVKKKSILQIYNKFCEVVSLLGDLVEIESLTDSIILKISQIGISPFFVENVNVLQLEALKVSRTVFRNYVKHRDLILDDILASLARLPSNKRNLRNYRLQDNICIQMFTALVLQLVQCTVQIPKVIEKVDSKSKVLVDKDVLIVKSYEDALRAAQNFMGIFLKKCSSNSKDENDFRPLFENFLHDLFLSANLPEWPAAEVLLTQLGRLFVVTTKNSKNDMTLRSTALDYLAQVATHLRKSVITSQHEEEREKLKLVVEKLINIDENDDVPVVEDMDVYDEKLRRSLLQYLQLQIQTDSSFKYAREFYLGQWIRDVQMEIEKSMIAPMLSIPGAATATVDEEEEQVKAEVSAEKLQILQEKKEFYHTLIGDKTVSILRLAQQLSYDNSCIVVNHLASTRLFSISFDLYMQQIFQMLSEQAIGLRTKAVKALTQIVSIDPTILAREDVQASVNGRLFDPSTNVREAAVDLIGQFVLKCPELIKQYYDMIVARILDTGVSVRKRVIKILRDICIENPDYEKIPEICSKIIRRVDDEVGIKKLVTEVFRAMWFMPMSNADRHANDLYMKAINITRVVSLCKDTGFDWLESLLQNLLDPENLATRTSTIKACQQIVDCLVMRMLKPELKVDSNVVNSCLYTLYLFCKSYPKLLVSHASMLQPYLSSKINNQNDTAVTQNVSKILELIVPLMEHPNPKFLAELEEDTMKLMLKQSQNVVQSSASCLAAIINSCTHNYKFIIDAFNQFFRFLTNYKADHSKAPTHQALKKRRPTLLRALFTIGLLVRHFDLDTHTNKETTTTSLTSNKVFDLVMYFADDSDDEIATKSLLSIGFIGIKHPQLLLQEQCRRLYQEILSPVYTSTKAKYTILKNLQNHLIEEEQRLQKAGGNKSPVKKRRAAQKEDVEFNVKKNIKEMGDALSGTTSEIVQVLLKDILKCFVHTEKQIRISALQAVAIILRQGLIHPAQCIPYLIAISTDNEKSCHAQAEQCLNDLDSRYQGFIHMKAFQGVQMSYQLQTVIQKNNGGYLVGFRESDNKISLINHVYGMIRSNKQYRRPFILSVLKQFDDKKITSDFLYYLTENLAYTTYNTQEEPLFVIHHIDTIASVSGANVLQSFREVLYHSNTRKDHKDGESPEHSSDDDDETEEKLSQDSKVDETKLKKIIQLSFGCLLLLELKAYLKHLYGFTDNKCQKYSPSEPSKLYDKAITRKSNQDFISQYKDIIFAKNSSKGEMLEYYFQFKNLMMSLDTEEESDSEEAVVPKIEEDTEMKEDVETKPTDPHSSDGENTVKNTLPQENSGVIPQSLEAASLPGLSININIPVIPMGKMLEVKPRKQSRRSSRSSRGSADNLD